MTDEIVIKSENAGDGDNVAKDEAKPDTETKENKETKQRSVSFNRDVHVKRFGTTRESRGGSSENQAALIRKEPFTHLSEQELIDEANKVIAQAHSVTCTADHPPDKFFSLPHRRKFKEDRTGRRNSDDGGSPEEKRKSSLGRSTSDVTSKKRKERTSLSTLFRRAQRNKSPEIAPVVVNTKPAPVIKRSKSDVSDLKSNTKLTQSKPIRKRSGSESEEFLKSLRNKKVQLSPIIESSPREDYFQKTSPLDVFQEKNTLEDERFKFDSGNLKSDLKKVNPVEKPPRFRTSEITEPKPPSRRKTKSVEKDKEIVETSKSKTQTKKPVLSDSTDSVKNKESGVTEVKDKIKESIRKIKENIYGGKEMIHSSQLPPEKPPLTRGNTVDHMVRILKEDQQSPPPKLNSPSNGSNINQPFSYTKPSTSPDPNLFARNTSPDRVPSPVNKMTDKGVVYAQVVRDRRDVFGKQTTHKAYSPSKEKYGNISDEDEGLGFEEKQKFSSDIKYDYDYKFDHENHNGMKPYKITDSPIRPRFREYKLTSFEDFEPTYANEYTSKFDSSVNYIDKFRGRADGMDNKKKSTESENHKVDLDFNELSHRRQLLESRINARKVDRERNLGEPISRYLAETDPIYEAQKRMKATEKYVNETAKYYRHTLERDGFAESTVTEDYSKYDGDDNKIKYNTETRTYQKTPKGEIERRNFVDSIDTSPRYKNDKKVFPPEPEYEPPSLEFNTTKPVLSPDEYKEKKYKVKKLITTSHDLLQTGQKYKGKDEWFGKRKGHYASNPEIAQEREDDYANARFLAKQPEAYHNSLRRSKIKDRAFKSTYGIHRHDSGDSRDYYRENGSPRRYDFDNRLVDSGIENDFRKGSSGEIHRSRHHRQDSDDDVRDTSLFLDSERRHTEDNYPSEQIYANGEYLARFDDSKNDRHKKEYVSREMSVENRMHSESKAERYDKSPSSQDEKVNTKPPKPKKLSGLERVKQLFSRDSSKKSKKEKDDNQPKLRTRVLKSPEHLERDDSDYRRYTDPEPSDITDIRKKSNEPKDIERRYHDSREDLDKYRNSDPRDVDPDRKYRQADYDRRYERTIKDRKYKEYREEKRRQHSSDRESDRHSRPSDGESELRKAKPRAPIRPDSPALADRYRERRRLATPSPTPSPPRRQMPQTSSSGWLKSLERVGRKREKSNTREESILTTEDESVRKSWSKPKQPLNSPAKNLRFFGDTDQDSDSNTIKQNTSKPKSHFHSKPHTTLKKTHSNSSTGLDEVDQGELSKKSYSLSNLHRQEKSESPRTKQYYKRSLHNISENQTNSEIESNVGKKISTKPPMSPYDRRSRSQSSSKTLRGSKNDLRRQGRSEERGSSSDLRTSKPDASRDSKSPGGRRHRTPAPASGESSTEGDSSHHSQRSVVYLHATTVGDIPDPGRLSRNRSKDDVSSVNSSNLQIRTTTKSFSLFAPWTPKHYHEQHDVHYAQKPRKPKSKETVTKASQSSKITPEYRPSTLQKNKSYSQSTLSRRPQNNRLTSSSTTLYRKPLKSSDETHNATMSRKTGNRDARKSQSNEVLSRSSDSERISRSISMPKDNNKKAGWFKLSNKNKKQEINTRVR